MWTILIPLVLTVGIVAAWLWPRSASPQPPGQRRRPPRRDLHDFPLKRTHEPPPEQGER